MSKNFERRGQRFSSKVPRWGRLGVVLRGFGRSTPGRVAIANERFSADKANFGCEWN